MLARQIGGLPTGFVLLQHPNDLLFRESCSPTSVRPSERPDSKSPWSKFSVAGQSSWTVGNSLVWGWNTTDINVYDGHGFVDVTGVGDTAPHGTLSQTLPTLVGQKYAFSVYTTLYDTVGINVSANGAPIILSGPYGTWDGTPTGAIWRQITGAFIADGTSSTIVIAGQPGFSFMIGLDDVSVTGPELAAVPELSSWALMFLGFAGLGVVGYHRAKRASPRYTPGERS